MRDEFLSDEGEGGEDEMEDDSMNDRDLMDQNPLMNYIKKPTTVAPDDKSTPGGLRDSTFKKQQKSTPDPTKTTAKTSSGKDRDKQRAKESATGKKQSKRTKKHISVAELDSNDKESSTGSGGIRSTESGVPLSKNKTKASYERN